MRARRGNFRRALEVSLLLHLLLVFLVLPRVHEVWPAAEAGALRLVPEPPAVEQAPLRFEFVDLAEEREETPPNARVPLSDLDRRAHGGEGEAAARPASQGNTPQRGVHSSSSCRNSLTFSGCAATRSFVSVRSA